MLKMSWLTSYYLAYISIMLSQINLILVFVFTQLHTSKCFFRVSRSFFLFTIIVFFFLSSNLNETNLLNLTRTITRAICFFYLFKRCLNIVFFYIEEYRTINSVSLYLVQGLFENYKLY
jgi:phage-related holin